MIQVTQLLNSPLPQHSSSGRQSLAAYELFQLRPEVLHVLTLDPLSALGWLPGTSAESPGALDLALDTLADPPAAFGLACDGEWAAGQSLVDFWDDWRGEVALALGKGWNWRTRNHPACPTQPGMGCSRT